jgi:hypothetical protein
VLTVLFLLALAAFVCTLLSMMGYPPPLWCAVLILCIIELLRHIPLGK